MYRTKCLNLFPRTESSQTHLRSEILKILCNKMDNNNKNSSSSNASSNNSNLKWISSFLNSNNNNNNNNNSKVLHQCSLYLPAKAPLPLHFPLTHIVHSKCITSIIICRMGNRNNNNNNIKSIQSVNPCISSMEITIITTIRVQLILLILLLRTIQRILNLDHSIFWILHRFPIVNIITNT